MTEEPVKRCELSAPDPVPLENLIPVVRAVKF
jgi:hypothetical protein